MTSFQPGQIRDTLSRLPAGDRARLARDFTLNTPAGELAGLAIDDRLALLEAVLDKWNIGKWARARKQLYAAFPDDAGFAAAESARRMELSRRIQADPKLATARAEWRDLQDSTRLAMLGRLAGHVAAIYGGAPVEVLEVPVEIQQGIGPYRREYDVDIPHIRHSHFDGKTRTLEITRDPRAMETYSSAARIVLREAVLAWQLDQVEALDKGTLPESDRPQARLFKAALGGRQGLYPVMDAGIGHPMRRQSDAVAAAVLRPAAPRNEAVRPASKIKPESPKI